MRNVILAGAAALALAGTLTGDEAEAVKKLRKHGASVKTDKKLPGGPVVEVFAPNLQTPDAGMAEIKSFPKLRRLTLTNSRVTDDGVKGLSALKELAVLHLYGDKVARKSVEEVGKMTWLTELDLGHNSLETNDIKLLAGLKALRRLTLTNLPHVKDEAMKVVAGFEKLERLDLAITGVGDAGLKELTGLKNLKELNLYGQPVTDQGMKPVGKMTNLERLNLGDTKITDAGLLELKGLAKLRRVRIEGTKVTAEGQKALRKELPKVIFGF